MTGIWGARCDMTCEMWDVMGLRCELILANLGKHSHHNISHIRKLLTLLHKYITHIKYHLAKISNLTKTDNNVELRLWQICGLLLLRPGHVWGSGVRRESAMSLIRSSSKRMKRARERERGVAPPRHSGSKLGFLLNSICLRAGWEMGSLGERLFWCLHIYGDRR